jgi:hypothetical protein
MRCFNHPAHEAAGICRHCNRGLCSDCIAIVEQAVACKGRCEQQVANIQRLIPKSLRTAAGTMRQAGALAVIAAVFIAGLSAIILYFNDGDEQGKYVGALFLALSFLVLVYGLKTLLSSRRYKQMADDSSSEKQPNPLAERYR